MALLRFANFDVSLAAVWRPCIGFGGLLGSKTGQHGGMEMDQGVQAASQGPTGGATTLMPPWHPVGGRCVMLTCTVLQVYSC